MLMKKGSRILLGAAITSASLMTSFGAQASSRGQSEINCLAEMIYHEARGESVQGQRAVAEVVLNRSERPDYPSDLCSVVRQKGQFAPKKPIREKAAFRRASLIAQEAVSGNVPKVTGGATHFHTPSVRPSWSRRFTRTRVIDTHIFYRQP